MSLVKVCRRKARKIFAEKYSAAQGTALPRAAARALLVRASPPAALRPGGRLGRQQSQLAHREVQPMTGQIELAAGPSAQAHGAPGAHLRIDARIKLLELGKERAILPAEFNEQG